VSRLLVDTDALLWWLDDAPELSAVARAAIADPANQPLVSTASVWEIAIKASLGKLTVPPELPDEIDDAGFTWLPVGVEHGWAARELPFHHRDPFDRLLIAQALEEHLPLVTRDPHFAAYGVACRW
jgi:PIN domain nuclease of toxin-antitoxin system